MTKPSCAAALLGPAWYSQAFASSCAGPTDSVTSMSYFILLLGSSTGALAQRRQAAQEAAFLRPAPGEEDLSLWFGYRVQGPPCTKQ